MTQGAVQVEPVVENGVIVGPVRRSVNAAINAKGSIHDDATASKLGFRGGTVAGSVHLDLFPPLLLKAFGQRWFERGTLSMFFLNATVDREPVRAFVRMPPVDARDTQVDVWIEREDGMRVGEGSASVGDAGVPTFLLQKPLDRFASGELRILKNVAVGEEFEPVDVVMPAEQQGRRLSTITEPLEWYAGPTPWGGPVVSPAGMVGLLYGKSVATLRPKLGSAVGLFGAIELRQINGPVFVDRDYRATGHIVALGQSPKTEYMWFETGINDADGKRVAEMRMLLRWMKASSPLYSER